MPVQESEVYNIKSGNSYAEISPLGGRIQNVNLDGNLVLRTVKRIDGKDANTHLCIPIFGPTTKQYPEIPQHGNARNSLMRVVSAKDNSLHLTYAVNEIGYPEGLQIDQRFSIDEKSFTVETFIHNLSGVVVPVNFAEHCYWDSPEGWQGALVNGENIANEIKKDTAILLQDKNEIYIPGKPKLYLIQSGLPIGQTWTGRNEDQTEFDYHYFCFEPAEYNPQHFDLTRQGEVKPNYSRRPTFTISL